MPGIFLSLRRKHISPFSISGVILHSPGVNLYALGVVIVFPNTKPAESFFLFSEIIDECLMGIESKESVLLTQTEFISASLMLSVILFNRKNNL